MAVPFAGAKNRFAINANCATYARIFDARKLLGYSGLAAIGQMVSGLAPQIPAEIERMRNEIERLRAILTNKKVSEAREALAELSESLGSISEYQRLMFAVTGKNEHRRAIDVVAEVSTFREFVEPLL